MTPSQNRYSLIIGKVFLRRFTAGDTEVEFERGDMVDAAKELGVRVPKNLGDLIYTFRYRMPLPQSVVQEAPEGTSWIIRPRGIAKYAFVATELAVVTPRTGMAETKVPDATPGIIAKYAFSDEQSLLARIRYNRLIDVFTGVACHSLQSHLRTTVPAMGQIETDEVYVGIDRRGAHYVFPVQAKGSGDQLGIVQVEQDVGMCASKFPSLLCRPIAAQFMDNDTIVLFELEDTDSGLRIVQEKHYRLVPPEEVTDTDLAAYRARTL